MNDKTPALAKQLIKVQADIKFGRLPETSREASIKAITDEGHLHSISKNEILTAAINNGEIYKAELEKTHGVLYVDK
ncbi:MAG: hypothetical protein JWR61_5653 [Ferruginibacter sp.]|uniref:hypothetical protein n=1 Tax=Ferruginibacter sp. TaxID=1940288 RepID=UPI00265B6F2F|nr:hypothetical protein [Ferruginibacter sp.]MDB5280698.1 hypothetical protein [Ferruginibacter sp.]